MREPSYKHEKTNWPRKKEKRYEGKRIISREERGVTRSFISFASSINSPQEANALNARYEEGGERR